MTMENRNLSEEERLYVFNKLPDNIRQMGEQPAVNRIYVEDYVVTYMHRIFREKAENALVVFVGKRGEGAAENHLFLYGAIEVELDILSWKEQFTAKVWDEIHEQIHRYFSGGEVMGWGCGVNIGNSQIKKAIAGIQRKHFSREGQVLFYWDHSEEEESVCRWQQGGVQPVSGYLIYYGKNPKMQEYMLRGKQKKSFEAAYQDTVMKNVRSVIQKKEQIHQGKKPAFYVAGGMLLALTVLGAWLLMQSNRKIEDLEAAIMTLSQKPVEDASSNKKEDKTTGTPKEKTTPTPVTTGDFATFEEKSLKSGKTAEISSSPVPRKKTGYTTDNPTVSPSPEEKRKAVADRKKGNNNKPVNTPAPSRSPKPSGTPKPAGVSRVNSYVVRQGDTLSQIVWRQYQTTAYLELVKKVNNIENEDEIQVGERIILPHYEK